MTKKSSAALILALCLPMLLHAAEDPCKTQRNTGEMNACAEQELKASDRELNAAYQELLKSLVQDDGSDTTNYAGIRQQLQKAQRAWIQYRDADCSAMYDLHINGSIRNLVGLRCKREKSVQRTKELKNWITY